MSRKFDFDGLFEELGGFGKFQTITVIMASFTSFLGGVHVVVPVFTSKTDQYRCKINECDDEQSDYLEPFLNFTIPEAHVGTWSQCSRYANVEDGGNDCTPQNFNQNAVVPCSEWVYDKSTFYRSTVTQFDLTCGKAWMTSLGNSFFMIGMLIGSVVIGYISDKYGRRIGVIISTVLLCSGCAIGAFSPFYIFFLAMRIISGSGTAGLYQTAFVLAIEYVGPKYRTACGILIGIPFALGECYLGLLAYLIRDWRYMQIAALSPVLLMIFSYFMMPESIRWLISEGRTEEALKIIKKAASVNRCQAPLHLFHDPVEVIDGEDGARSHKRLKDILKSNVMLQRTALLFYCWMTAAMCYFGLSAYGSDLSGNVFINFTALVSIEIPSYFASFFFIDRLGRKAWHIIVFFIAGLGCIVTPIFSEDQKLLILLTNLTGKFGASAAFASLFLFSGELYPTEFRASGVGACAMASRIGGIIAPFINTFQLFYKQAPSFVYGILSLVAGCFIFFLPETLGSDLPQTIEECEQFNRNQATPKVHCCQPEET